MSDPLPTPRVSTLSGLSQVLSAFLRLFSGAMADRAPTDSPLIVTNEIGGFVWQETENSERRASLGVRAEIDPPENEQSLPDFPENSQWRERDVILQLSPDSTSALQNGVSHTQIAAIS